MHGSREPASPVIADKAMPAAGHLLEIGRGLCMAIVLYGHALEIFFQSRADGGLLASAFIQYKVLAAFAMAAFFFLAGAAAPQLQRKGWRNIVRTSLYLVALAYLAHGLGVSVALVELLARTGGDGLDELLRRALAATLKGDGFSIIVVWFLVTLAAVRLIGALVMRQGRAAGWMALAALFGLSFAIPLVPNLFGLKSWFGGAFFFLLGMLRSDLVRRVPGWLWLPLIPVVAGLALANGGCLTDAASRCGHPSLQGDFAVWIHLGLIGFVPAFFAAGAAGCLLVLSLARRLAATPLAGSLARLGRRSLDVLIVNGFLLVFVQPRLGAVPASEAMALLYPVLPVAVVALHLWIVRLLERPLAGLNRLALRLADLALRAVERLTGRGGPLRPPVPADGAA